MNLNPTPHDVLNSLCTGLHPNRVLITGSRVVPGKPDRRKQWAEAVTFGVDAEAGEGVDMVADLEQPWPEAWGKFNLIECTSVLEHTPRPWKMAENVEAALVPGGMLLLAVPFIWRVHNYPSDYWRFTMQALRNVLFPNIEWQYMAHLHLKLKVDTKVPVLKQHDHPFLARTEIVALGVRK